MASQLVQPVCLHSARSASRSGPMASSARSLLMRSPSESSTTRIVSHPVGIRKENYSASYALSPSGGGLAGNLDASLRTQLRRPGLTTLEAAHPA
jgi:hypothetical protein